MTTPPNHLSAESKKEWRRFGRLFTVDDDAALILTEYLEARERKTEAQAAIAKDGLILIDRFGQRKVHPAANVARDCQSLMLRALKALGLPSEGAPDPDHPERQKWSGGRKPRAKRG